MKNKHRRVGRRHGRPTKRPTARLRAGRPKSQHRQLVDEWNAQWRIGQRVAVLDSPIPQRETTTTSKAMTVDGEAVVRVQGTRTPVPLTRLAPLT